ncbi:MAG: hypothetical protein QNJ04_17115 [Desulfobacterales bacterium]|nr:hypothetical protein [Desulfobacterales bacterium]
MTIQPQGDAIRKAVKWLSEERQADAAADISRLVEQAAVKFDLNPMETEFLTKFAREEL